MNKLESYKFSIKFFNTLEIISGYLLALVIISPAIILLVLFFNKLLNELILYIKTFLECYDDYIKIFLMPYIMCLSVLFLGVGGKNRAIEDKNTKIYQDLDKQYQELLKLVMAYPIETMPQINNIGIAGNTKHNSIYNAFAFMMWNFIETIYDNTKGSGRREVEYNDLWETWSVIIKTEGTNHIEWFKNNKNNRFKKSFIKWAEDNIE
ncbi:MAG: hypothetical protein H7839_06830 [Magnetococcus sp. YQC-5]